MTEIAPSSMDMPIGGRGRSRHRWGPIPAAALPAIGVEKPPPTKRRRRSRWETAEPSDTAVADETQKKTSASESALILFPSEVVLSNGLKIDLPPALTGRHPTGDHELVKLHQELIELERKIRSGIVDIPPEHERSPSPPPVYDANGVRQNTREQRYREKQTKRRTTLIEELIKRDPTYKPPADYKPEKKWRKLPIPYREYPDYNFIGLIIGPRGNTQKRMQTETNTRIAIRGRGSVKEGAARHASYDYGEEEDLHVLVVGDTQEDVDKASAMVERLLQPMDEEMNAHKQQQLRELALINGTLREEDLVGKKALDVYTLPDAIQAKVEEQYALDLAKVNPHEAAKDEEEYRSFLAELGGTDPRALSNASPGNVPQDGGAGNRLLNPCKLWVGNLAPTVDSIVLRTLFEPYGRVVLADVKMDSGASRGYGFVTFSDEIQAKAAIEALNGHFLEGRNIVVRVKGERSEDAGGFRKGIGFGGQASRHEEAGPPECRIYVGHVPSHIDEGSVRREFERFGTVVSMKMIMDRETGRHKGYGFITMGDPQATQAAIANLNGYAGLDPMRRPIVVRQAGENPPGPGGGFHRHPGGGMPSYPGAGPMPPYAGQVPMGYGPGAPPPFTPADQIAGGVAGYMAPGQPPLPSYPPMPPSGTAAPVPPPSGGFQDSYGMYGSYQPYYPDYAAHHPTTASAPPPPPPENQMALGGQGDGMQPPLPSGPPPPPTDFSIDNGMDHAAPPLPPENPPLPGAPPPPSFDGAAERATNMPPPPPPTFPHNGAGAGTSGSFDHQAQYPYGYQIDSLSKQDSLSHGNVAGIGTVSEMNGGHPAPPPMYGGTMEGYPPAASAGDGASMAPPPPPVPIETGNAISMYGNAQEQSEYERFMAEMKAAGP